MMIWGKNRSPWAEREAYRLGKAQTLLRPALADLQERAIDGRWVWADLGCGNGIFTSALYTLLPGGSEIYGVDQNRSALKELVQNFAESYPEAICHPVEANFAHPLPPLPPLDGSVMANSLHFVRHKESVLARIVGLLKPGGRLIVIEYNAARGNFAVPHPIDERGFLALAEVIGLQQVRIAAKIPSTFLGEMYAGVGFVGGQDQVSRRRVA